MAPCTINHLQIARKGCWSLLCHCLRKHYRYIGSLILACPKSVISIVMNCVVNVLGSDELCD